jgi:hypothetical protein
MPNNDGGPAFPQPESHGQQQLPNGTWEQEYSYPEQGMSLRDWFAGMAMQGFMSNSMNGPRPLDYLAKCCYEVADAMIAELNKGEK